MGALLAPPLQADGFSACPDQGGLVGNDETVALTAFVVIALHHGLAVFQDRSAEQLKQRVVRAPHLPCAGLALPAAPQDPGVRPQTFLHGLTVF